ncbi:MAG: HEPN domain-containing protein [Candidatus Micrarchaeota archaeon]|nr:HEPN domain-containing protein [Candidatus Micrarchaeota archaeon]
MNLEQDCIRKGLIRKMPPDLQKAQNSIRIAEMKLSSAKEQSKAGFHESAFITAYTSMFHSARALLSRDGFKERSHYCIYIYISEKYAGRIGMKYLNELNSMRMIRHKVMYGDEEEVRIREVEETEAESSIRIAEGFLGEVKKLLS